MFGGMGWMHGLRAKKTTGGGGGGSDVTPDAIGWETYVEDTNPSTSHQSITGIDTTINIYYEFILSDGGDIQYSKNSAAYVSLSSNTNISVSNGDTISWKWVGDLGGYAAIIDVRNDSDADALLGEITLVEASGGGGPD